MMKQCLAALLSAGMLAGTFGGVSVSAAAVSQKEEQMELKTWYSAPALDGSGSEDWQKEGTPIGNGSLGGMVYGGVKSDRILINEKTVWSGGPGSSSRYDGGITDTYTSEEVKANLQELRQKLQDLVSDFTKHKSAYVDENGNVVSQNYGTLKKANELIPEVSSQSSDGVWEDKELQALIVKLRGEKDFFGSYQMLSDLYITDETGDTYSDYYRGLDLRTAVNTVRYTKADGVTYQKEYFVSEPDGVLVVRLTADKKGALTRTIEVKSDQPKAKYTAVGDTLTMTGLVSDQMASGLHYAQQLRVIPTGGTMEITGTKRAPKFEVTGADEILLVLSAGTNYQQPMDGSYDFFSEEDPLVAVAARVNAAVDKGYEGLIASHIADYDALFDRVDFTLDGVSMPTDKDTAALLAGYRDGSLSEAECRYLELLYYQFGRYLLIASSREGSLPANLQGIWADGLNPPWGADYHTNINIQMNYWLAEQTNLSECHIPMLEYTTSLAPYGEKVAQYYYCKQDGSDVRGWAIGHENTIWGNTAPGVWYWGYYFPAAAAWMCQHYWEHYQFTMDKDFLADSFDTMLSAALFWVDNLWTDERDGTLVANPSYSPEHGPYSLGASCDQEIIWGLFDEVIQAAEVLNITDEQTASEVAEVKAAMEKLYMPKIGLAGEFLEWKDETTLDITGDGGHRHVNHLYALHPGNYVVAGRSEEDDEAVEAMKVTLNTRGDGGTGWSKAWKINFWARLRDGDHAETMVNQILKESTLNNLFDTHPPFQIDGNFGATAGMTEMLLQSQGDSIDLLAALPSAWADGAVRGLKARGNFTVDMTWAGQQLTAATITSNAGSACTLNYYGLSRATVTRQSDGKEVEVTTDDKNTITFATEAGESYVIRDIPQDKKSPKQVTLLRTVFNNLYTDKMVENTGCPDSNGAYVESFQTHAAGARIGLEQGDVVRTFNGTALADTDALQTMYNAAAYGDVITLGVWRQGKTLELRFTKMEPLKNYGDLYVGIPGRIYSGGYATLFNDIITTTVDGSRCLKGPGVASFRHLISTGRVTGASAEVLASGEDTIIVRENYIDGDVIATIPVQDTNGAFAVVEGTVSRTPESEMPDLFVEIVGNVTLKWVELSGGGTVFGDANGDGKVTTADAATALQYAAEVISSDALDLVAADVNGDGKVTTADAALILQKCAELIETFPVE